MILKYNEGGILLFNFYRTLPAPTHQSGQQSIFSTFERRKQKQSDKRIKLLFGGFRKNVEKAGE